MTSTFIIPATLLVFLVAGFLFFHWRYHPRRTPLVSYDDLQGRLGRGRPVLLQFHAPL